ncbi:MAG: FMN-binding protein [Bdellovibrionales bacterium]|nr:FMN-binding protein [Bdellovibrionales bacterium]
MKIFLVASAFVLVATLVNAEEFKTVAAFVKSELGDAPKLSQEMFTISAEQKKEMSKVAENATEDTFKFFYGKKDDALLKACTIVSQSGKEGPMQVGVCFGPDRLVRSVTVLSHVEERGKGIEASAYLNQFKDKKIDSAFEVGKDVTIKSGATYSSKAVSESVRKASFAFKTFVLSK